MWRDGIEYGYDAVTTRYSQSCSILASVARERENDEPNRQRRRVSEWSAVEDQKRTSLPIVYIIETQEPSNERIGMRPVTHLFFSG